MSRSNLLMPVLILTSMVLLLALVVLGNLGVIPGLGKLWYVIIMAGLLVGLWGIGYDPYGLRAMQDRVNGLSIESEVQMELLRLERQANHRPESPDAEENDD